MFAMGKGISGGRVLTKLAGFGERTAGGQAGSQSLMDYKDILAEIITEPAAIEFGRGGDVGAADAQGDSLIGVRVRLSNYFTLFQ